MPLEGRANAECHDGGAMPGRHAHDVSDFVRSHGKRDDIGLASRVPRFAVAVMLDLGGIGGAAVAEQRPQVGDKRCPRRV